MTHIWNARDQQTSWSQPLAYLPEQVTWVAQVFYHITAYYGVKTRLSEGKFVCVRPSPFLTGMV